MLHLEGGYHYHFYTTERLSQLTIDISWLYDFQHAKSDSAFWFLVYYDDNKNDKSKLGLQVEQRAQEKCLKCICSDSSLKSVDSGSE